MALTESRLPTGRITLTQLHNQLTLSPAAKADLCTLSSNNVEVYVASSLANIKHINSCLQKTMIKHWRCGFLGNGAANQKHQQQQQQKGATVKASRPNTAQLQLQQQERQRLTFIEQYRAAYEPICVATDRLRALLQTQISSWDSKSATQQQNTIADIEGSARTHYDAVAHLVLNLLPGHLFLEVYSQEDSHHIFHDQRAESEYAATCLSTHLPLHTSQELPDRMQPSKKNMALWRPSRCIAACAMGFRLP